MQDITGGTSIPTVNSNKTQPVRRVDPVDWYGSGLIGVFLKDNAQLLLHVAGQPVELDGTTLSLPAIVAVARYGAPAKLSSSKAVKDRVKKSRAAIEQKLDSRMSIYGISTGFGGSADTRTNAHSMLGLALLQHQNSGIISTGASGVLPMDDPIASTTMPESWVRAAMLIRTNSLIRGHSAVRWELLQSLTDMLSHNISPLVPLRGSISASGDLSPLSYVAGALGGNSSIRVYADTRSGRRIVPAREALAKARITPISLAPKEHLGILNGTAFSAAVGSLVLVEATQLAILAQVCTAMGTEALLGTRASYAPFIHNVARPHPGQIEVANVLTRLLDGSRLAGEAEETELTTEEDKGELRQDRYSLRTAPQFIGPQIEDIMHAVRAVTLECNSTTDNPLIDGETGRVHHGGNFQAMVVTNAMEKTRLALHHLGKILFAQSTELLNPAFNRGLPPSAAATDPSLNYHCKGLDIATAAYVSELGYLANPVSTHIQSSEMHNQAVNSLALISARATVTSLDVLTMLTASYLYILCQAMDLRAMQIEFSNGLESLVAKHLKTLYPPSHAPNDDQLLQSLLRSFNSALESTTTMDAQPRMEKVSEAALTPLVNYFSQAGRANSIPLEALQSFCQSVSRDGFRLLDSLRGEFLGGARGSTPASQYMGRTRALYEFVRRKLGIRMHGSENQSGFDRGLHTTEQSIGENVTKIYEAIRDGRMQGVLASMVSQSKENRIAKL